MPGNNQFDLALVVDGWFDGERLHRGQVAGPQAIKQLGDTFQRRDDGARSVHRQHDHKNSCQEDGKDGCLSDYGCRRSQAGDRHKADQQPAADGRTPVGDKHRLAVDPAGEGAGAAGQFRQQSTVDRPSNQGALRVVDKPALAIDHHHRVRRP